MNPTHSGSTSFPDLEAVVRWLETLAKKPSGGSAVCGSPGKLGVNPSMVDSRLPGIYQPQHRCLNADNKHMLMICSLTAPAGQALCGPCTDYADDQVSRAQASLRPHIRTILASARSCQLTPGCQGTMRAALKWAGPKGQFPELWWHCPACTMESLYETGFCKPAQGKVMSLVPRVRAANINRKKFLDMNGADALAAYRTETAQMGEHVRDIIGPAPLPELVRIANNALNCDGSGPKLTCTCTRCMAYYKDQQPAHPGEMP